MRDNTIYHICPYIDQYVAEVLENGETLSVGMVRDILMSVGIFPPELTDEDLDPFITNLARNYCMDNA